jgi:uncharacterized protein YlxP (DUF503 family)
MTVGSCKIELRIPDSQSLKAKRRVVKSLKDRVQARFNVGIAEVDRLDDWQRATLAVAAVSKDARVVDGPSQGGELDRGERRGPGGGLRD